MERLDKYEHYPKVKAYEDFDNGVKDLYKVTTINWTFGTENGKQNHNIVHKNEYTMSLEALVSFIQELEGVLPNGETYCISEDVVNIEKIDN